MQCDNYITITITIGVGTGDLLIMCTLNIGVSTSVTPALVHKFLTQAEALLLSNKCYYYPMIQNIQQELTDGYFPYDLSPLHHEELPVHCAKVEGRICDK